jgi:hypothetical protein
MFSVLVSTSVRSPGSPAARLQRIGVKVAAKVRDCGLQRRLGDVLPTPAGELVHEILQADPPGEKRRDPAIVGVDSQRPPGRDRVRPRGEKAADDIHPAEGGAADEDDLTALRQGHAEGCDASVSSYVRRSRSAQ